MADALLHWSQVDPTARYPDHRWRARSPDRRLEFRILVHRVSDHDRFHLHWINLDEEGEPTGRLWYGPSCFGTLEQAQAAAEDWLANA